MKINIAGKIIGVYKLIDCYELDPICIEGAGSFLFVIHIYKEAFGDERFFAKVYRREFFRLTPMFHADHDSAEKIVSDEELLVEDIARPWSEQRMASAAEVMGYVLTELEAIFTH